MKIKHNNPELVVKRAFFLAWKACGETFGMGMLQDNPNANKEAVWENVKTRGDYPGSGPENAKPGSAYGDYVFGRMMKLSIDWDSTSVNRGVVNTQHTKVLLKQRSNR